MGQQQHTRACPPTVRRGRTPRQVKVAEHVLTGHKVAIKILNRKKIKQMDMEEKGGVGVGAASGRRTAMACSSQWWGARRRIPRSLQLAVGCLGGAQLRLQLVV